MRSAGGDSPAQLEHRAAFLAKGHLDLITDEIAARIGDDVSVRRLLDIGCGTGYHLARLLRHLVAQAPEGSGIDISKHAASRCARCHPDLGFAVADIWSRWPVRSQSADVVTSIFAPKNWAEMARVLKPDGLLAIAFPGARHFLELRRGFDLLGVSVDKRDAYAARMTDGIGALARKHVVQRVRLEREDIRDAILMGPSARHLSSLQPDSIPRRMDVTIDIELLFARKRWT